MSPATDTSTNTPASVQQAAVEPQTSAVSLEQQAAASFANLTRSFYKTYLEGLAALKAGPTDAANRQTTNVQSVQEPFASSVSEANVEAFASPDFSPRSQQLPRTLLDPAWRDHTGRGTAQRFSFCQGSTGSSGEAFNRCHYASKKNVQEQKIKCCPNRKIIPKLSRGRDFQ